MVCIFLKVTPIKGGCEPWCIQVMSTYKVDLDETVAAMKASEQCTYEAITEAEFNAWKETVK
jgi:hypothetical protein